MNPKEISNAPIVELVVGLHLNSIVFSNKEIIDFYGIIKDRYPIIQEHPPIPYVGDNMESDQNNPDRFFHSL